MKTKATAGQLAHTEMTVTKRDGLKLSWFEGPLGFLVQHLVFSVPSCNELAAACSHS